MSALRLLESQHHLKAQLIKQSQNALHKMAEPKPPPSSPSVSLSIFAQDNLFIFYVKRSLYFHSKKSKSVQYTELFNAHLTKLPKPFIPTFLLIHIEYLHKVFKK